MAYLVLAYPTLHKSDYDLIQSHRKDHDRQYSVVDPHFTVVFSTENVASEKFISEIKNKSKDIRKINFTIRRATINKDAFSDYYYIFLVPDEGSSDILKLHDKLYSEILASNLRLDLDFIPHITIGNSKDKFDCKRIVDEWNSRNFCIKGGIDKLTIVEHIKNTVVNLETIALK